MFLRALTSSVVSIPVAGVFFFFALVPGVLSGAEAKVDFVRDIRPLLEKHCYSCHGAERQKSGLRLDIKSEALRGGEIYGPAIVTATPLESPLLLLVRGHDGLTMPPEGDDFSSAEKDLLTRWFEEGAIWPDGVDLAKLEDRRDHWSFKPVTALDPPEVSDADWCKNPSDRFVLAKLNAEGLSPAPDAIPRDWLRRVTFDLTGLPPTPEELATFLSEIESRGTEPAYESVVERLLQSPRHGERWAQHWLDVVRYADTHGFEVNTERPNAWPYRDYVIDAFNRGTPYDQFLREQIAGDLTSAGAATGFLVTASVLLPGQIGKDEPSIRLARQDSLDEIVVNIGQTFLGLSIGCARCHDHKFDPVSQREYYAMQAFVAGVEYADRELQTPIAIQKRAKIAAWRERLAAIDQELAGLTPLARSGAMRAAVNARMNVDRFAPIETRRVRFTIEATNSLEPCIDELEVFDSGGTNVALAKAGATVTSSGDIVVANRHELRQINDGEYGNSRSWMSSEMGRGWVIVEFPEPKTVTRVVWGRDRQEQYKDRLPTSYRIEVENTDGIWQLVADATDRQPFQPDQAVTATFSPAGLSPEEAQQGEALIAERKRIEDDIRAADVGLTAFAGTFRTPDEIRLLTRGDPEQPKDTVIPAVPEAIGSLTLPLDASEETRRRELAVWITNPANPLTARVMVNRVWQWHFGTGLVDTASDFGRTGSAPSHPELLDWLATEFVRSGWSLKHLHRLIVLSATYRQSQRYDAAAAAKDVDVRLLWRFPSRRLDAEEIRDAMLAVSGRLNLKMGGPGFDLFDKRGGLSGFTPVESFSGDGLRRMIYAHKVRRERDAVFGAFDCPDAGQSTARRRESTTPIQALNLLNSTFTLEQSEALAKRVQQEAGDDRAKQIDRLYVLVLGRTADDDERLAVEPVVREHGLATVARVLFNSNEFLFVP